MLITTTISRLTSKQFLVKINKFILEKPKIMKKINISTMEVVHGGRGRRPKTGGEIAICFLTAAALVALGTPGFIVVSELLACLRGGPSQPPI